MHVEYSMFLRGELQNADFSKLLPEVREQDVLEKIRFAVLNEIQEVSVERAPKDTSLMLGSSLPIDIVQIVRRFEKDHVPTPEMIAERFVEGIAQSTRGAQFFPIQIGGRCYLNTTPSAECFKMFFQKLFRTRGQALLWRESLFADSEPSTPLFLPGGFQLNDVLPVSGRRASEDIRLLAAQVINTHDGRWDEEYRVMLLALMTESNLAVESFISGAHGSENAPWYFKKFFRDTLAVEQSGKKRGDRIELLVSELNYPLPEDAEKMFGDSLSLLLEFRGAVLKMQFFRRPDLLMGMLLKLIASFYSFYNRPQVRRVLRQWDDSVSCALVFLLSAAVRAVVSGGYSSIDFNVEQGRNYLLDRGENC